MIINLILSVVHRIPDTENKISIFRNGHITVSIIKIFLKIQLCNLLKGCVIKSIFIPYKKDKFRTNQTFFHRTETFFIQINSKHIPTGKSPIQRIKQCRFVPFLQAHHMTAMILWDAPGIYVHLV